MSCEMFSATERTARRPHRCIWCAEAIQPGEKYIDRAYRFEGEFCADKMHPECRDACNRFYAQPWVCPWDGFSPGDFDRGSIEEKGTAARLTEAESGPDGIAPLLASRKGDAQ